MSDRWPKLSETLTGKSPMSCNRCGKTQILTRWRECDDSDRNTSIVIVLCRNCSNEIIEPHPRLYQKMGEFEPHPGTMTICHQCLHREKLACTNAKLKSKGGPGLEIRYPQPGVAFYDGVKNGKRTGWRETVYYGPVTCAEQKE